MKNHGAVFPLMLVVLFAFGCSSPLPPSYGGTTSAQADSSLRPGSSRTLVKNSGAPAFNLDAIENSSAPLFADIRVPVTLSRSDDLAISGWAVDKANSKPAGGVDIVIDGIAWQADLGGKRPDVESFFKNPAFLLSGFQFLLHSGSIAPGAHSLVIRVISNDRQSYRESPELHLIIK